MNVQSASETMMVLLLARLSLSLQDADHRLSQQTTCLIKTQLSTDSVADEELAGLKTIELTPYVHEEQANIRLLPDVWIGVASEVDLVA